MKAKEIRDLIDFISNSGLDEVNIETQEFKIAVKKNSPVTNTVVESQAPVVPIAPQNALEATHAQTTTAPQPQAGPPAESNNYLEIKSPMIGTFYESANPESGPFVNVGDTVKVGQTVCIVEAMKLFNEIESEYTGKVVKILVENASPVEYDQPLFLIDPS
jgi:acetyl-CoA carboxylase biotin carboxyl carrier protein